MKHLILISLILSGVACSHTPTERETYENGVKQGYAMGRAPQILPIQIQPVSVSESTVRTVINPDAGPEPLEYGETYPGELAEASRKFFKENGGTQ